MFKLASWNVNSLKIRLPHVLDWLEATKTDVLALQETKVRDENFPLEDFKERGYFVEFSGQKTYNGMAIISKKPMQDVMKDIPQLDDPQRRILAATINDIRLINLYVPNGSEPSSDKYQYKLDWLDKVKAFVKEQLEMYPKLAVVGDFNIAPADIDVHDPQLWEGNVLVSPKEREAFYELLDTGLVDSFRELAPDEVKYSWWDYRAAAFRRNRGLRIDHILLSKALVNDCEIAGIDVEQRRLERPSDHAPVWADIRL